MSETFRWGPAVAAIAAAAGLALLLAFVSRGVNRPPAITKIDVQPAVVLRDGSATLRVSAQDPDGDALRFEYKTTGGRIAAEPARPGEARYTPTDDVGIADRVTVTVSDNRGLSSTSETVVTIAPAETTAATPTPPPESTALPMPAPTEPTASPEPTRRPQRMRTAPPSSTDPPPAATRPPNRPPVLERGYPIQGVANTSVRVLATGHDPDGDEVTHEWDGSGCFEILHQSATEAEVKFAEGCTGGSMRLTWTDPHGASASAEWPIRK